MHDPDDVDHRFMLEAIAEARLAEGKGEVPVGAVIVIGDRVVGRGHNLRETTQDPTAHAEMIALREAAAAIGSWRLEDATCYVTLEPCPMCAGALVNARVARVVYGADDPKAGATTTLYTIGTDPRLNHRFVLAPNVLGPECGALLTEFFGRIRAARRAGRAVPRPGSAEASTTDPSASAPSASVPSAVGATSADPSTTEPSRSEGPPPEVPTPVAPERAD